jgi:hypothetical protein
MTKLKYDMKNRFSGKHYIVFILLAIVSTVAYSNTFDVPFLFDDRPNIIENKLLRDLADFTPASIERMYTASGNRFIGFLTFALNFRMHGPDVTGYHVVNLLIHIVNAFLVYCLAMLTFKTPKLKGSCLAESSGYIALFSGLLFASHPLMTQAVTYIVQRFTLLAAMFYLLSLVMYIKARLAVTSDGGGVSKSCYVVSIISAVLAMKTKEMVFTLPAVAALYEFIFFQGKIYRRILYLTPLLLTMLIIPLSLLNIDKPLGEVIGDISEQTRVQTHFSRENYLFTQFSVIATYIRLLFLPVNQNLDYDYPRYYSLFNTDVLISFLFLLVIAGSGIYLYYRYRDSVPHTRVITFGVFWFFMTLSVESSIIPIVDVIFEHRVYLPAAGVFVALSVLIFSVMEKLKSRRVGLHGVIVPVLVLIIVLLTGASYARNKVW